MKTGLYKKFKHSFSLENIEEKREIEYELCFCAPLMADRKSVV